MKILVVIPSWSYRGGEKIFLKLAEALTSEGNAVTVIAGRREHSATYYANTVTVVYPRVVNSLLLSNGVSFLFGWLVLAWQVLRLGKGADLIISESNNCLIASVIGKAVYHYKLVWYVMAYESKHYRSRVKEVIWNCSFGVVEKLCLTQVDYVFALSDKVQAILRDRLAIRSTVLHPIINDRVDYTISSVDRKLKHFYQHRRVWFLPAVLHWKKNQALAITMLKLLLPKHPDLGLVLAGDGPDRTKLTTLVDELKLGKHVMFAGVLAGDSLAYAYANSVCTLTCSLSDNEGLSLTALESLIAGTPVVVSAQAGISRFIQSMHFGAVCDPRVDEFEDAIERVMANTAKYKTMADRAKAYITRQFGPKKVVQTVLSVIST